MGLPLLPSKGLSPPPMDPPPPVNSSSSSAREVQACFYSIHGERGSQLGSFDGVPQWHRRVNNTNCLGFFIFNAHDQLRMVGKEMTLT
jgi:hypothetical protein